MTGGGYLELLSMGRSDRVAWSLGVRQRAFRLQRDACRAHGAEDVSRAPGPDCVYRVPQCVVRRVVESPAQSTAGSQSAITAGDRRRRADDTVAGRDLGGAAAR